MKGVITKGIAGFYYVYSDGKIFECKARGKFRKKGLTPMVGDMVEVSLDSSSTASNPAMLAGTVDSLLPRKNEFDRPPIANVDTVVIVAAAKDPEPLTYIIDRMAVAAELKDVEIIVCLNKSDLADRQDIVDSYKNVYPVVSISTKTGEGVNSLKEMLAGKQVALAGPSGVGKSSITNALLGTEGILSDAGNTQKKSAAEVGEISSKTLRGKNTTRHSELFAGDGFFLFDTPGFTSFEAPELEETELSMYFPEFEHYLGKCRFDNCQHLSEPDCLVKSAVSEGKISKSRYESYKTIYKELKERKRY